MKMDPITLEVVCEGLIAVVREMRASIIRASYSPVIYELDDFSCALFNDKAEMVAQSDDHPGHVMPMPWSVRCAMEDFKGDIHPGDIILLNDAYRGGTHLNDVTLIYPVFVGERLALLPAVRSHWADVGGATPGSYSGLSTNIYQEGLRMPPIKLFERGKENRAVMRLIEANMRLPEHRKGDLSAMLGAVRVAEARLRRLFDKYGLDTVLACVAANLDRVEARMREAIRALPKGTFVYEDYLEYFDDGRFDPVLMRLALTVEGDRVIADFEGSNPQVPGVVNSSLAVAGAGVFVALKATLDPGGAVNDGAFRPITLKAPEASIVDVRPDAPAGAHGEVRKRAVSVMLGCLAQIVPERVAGDLCGTSFPNSIGGRARGRRYVYYEVPAGGNGGFAEADGSSAFVNVDFGNIRSIHTAESLEIDMPFVVERSELRADSGGAGEHRGGLGLRREVRLVEAEGTYSVLSDRAVIPPFGVAGGGAAAAVDVKVVRNGLEKHLGTPGKTTGMLLREGDIVVMQSAGGGGYGDPLARDPQLVEQDVAAGYVSAAQARAQYGVIAGDSAATARLRTDLRSSGMSLEVAEDESDPYEGIRGRHRMLRLHPSSGLEANHLVELLGRHPAPLRAWVKLDPSVGPGAAPLDAFGCRVLGVAPGARVRLRVLPSPVEPGARRER
ncbi:MAG TPA: hydantoinase B/oxoprolinase family protein [Burkholderiales bacterium]|nr:hydantoinase B/oxoprolinase family protein [Burkholderiales bacterium]